MTVDSEVFHPLSLDARTRAELRARIATSLENYWKDLEKYPVKQKSRPEELETIISNLLSGRSQSAVEVFDSSFALLRDYQMHSSHPMYFGVFNPRPSYMGIVAEEVAAALNPQLASSLSGLVASLMEKKSLQFLHEKMKWPETAEGFFCGGGTEANLCAVLCALSKRFPTLQTEGLRSLTRSPRIYVSTETHHSFLRAAQTSGLGSQSVREVKVSESNVFDTEALEEALREDRAAGFDPLMLVATLGSTSTGAVDPLTKLVTIARREKMWLHVDAAWGGAALLLPEFAPHFAGIEEADSVTIDGHKWFSLPMTCGIFLQRHPQLLKKTFYVGHSPYMPPDIADVNRVPEPYSESLQWSRRFAGFKFFLTLAAAGEEGYAQVLRHQIKMADSLRERLRASAWELAPQSPWPVCCFSHPSLTGAEAHLALVKKIQDEGRSWITSTELGGRTWLRAGISSYATEARHIDLLVEILNQNVRA